MMNTDFEDVVKSVAIPPKLTSQAKEAISKSWANNLDLYIKGWADEAILKLRGKVMDNTMRGQRSANMIKSIVEEYGVSQRKAKFLARQETSLLMSKFQEERYKDVGITKYRWSGSMDKRERHDHKLLEGKIISWDSPPITNRETGARNHAGQDFGCRCVAIPIVESAL
jgi:SPP1 gp7 family putative phage head morphogenesis protein